MRTKRNENHDEINGLVWKRNPMEILHRFQKAERACKQGIRNAELGIRNVELGVRSAKL
jgi:hypothetical protein